MPNYLREVTYQVWPTCVLSPWAVPVRSHAGLQPDKLLSKNFHLPQEGWKQPLKPAAPDGDGTLPRRSQATLPQADSRLARTSAQPHAPKHLCTRPALRLATILHQVFYRSGSTGENPQTLDKSFQAVCWQKYIWIYTSNLIDVLSLSKNDERALQEPAVIVALPEPEELCMAKVRERNTVAKVERWTSYLGKCSGSLGHKFAL